MRDGGKKLQEFRLCLQTIYNNQKPCLTLKVKLKVSTLFYSIHPSLPFFILVTTLFLNLTIHIVWKVLCIDRAAVQHI